MPSSVSGCWKYANGQAVSGTLYIQLVGDATVTGTAQIAPKALSTQLDSSGSIPATFRKIYQSTELTPNTNYTLSVVATGGATVWSSGGPVSLTGSPIDLNSLVPNS